VRHESRSGLGDTVGEGETEFGLDELFDVRPAEVGNLLDLLDTEDVDGPEAGTMPGSHILVQGVYSSGAGEFANLLVHVVRSRTRVITNPDAKVFNFQRLGLGDNVNGNDLAAGLLCLVELAKEIPETGLGHDLVRREDAHAEKLGRWVLSSRELAPNDLILLESRGHF